MPRCGELIDTLWNVNVGGDRMDKQPSERINRYIMECKCVSSPASSASWQRINRYIMECKFFSLMIAFLAS